VAAVLQLIGMLVISVGVVMVYGIVGMFGVGVAIFLLGLLLELKRPARADDE
jgi:hypothetical protein